MRTIAAVFVAALVLGGCTSPTGDDGGGRWWPQDVGWRWLYEATLEGAPEELEVRIEDTEEHGDRECYLNEFGDYDAHEGGLVAVYPASDEAYEIWNQRGWVELDGFWVEMELRYTDPVTAHVSGTLNEPETDTGEGQVYVGGIPIGSFEVTLTSETVETGVELEVQGNTYSDLRKVEFIMETEEIDPVTSEAFFKRGVGLVKSERLWNFDGLELISYEKP
jgi:hypothetical protein